MRPTPLVFDTDPGIDDAFALALALASPELDVQLVTTVFGNSDLHTVTANAGLLLETLHGSQALTLARGAARPRGGALRNAEYFHGLDGLGGCQQWLRDKGVLARSAKSRAAHRIVRAAREYQRDLTIVAVGPLTNIAHAIDIDAAAMANIGNLIVMGGAVRVAGNVSAGAEFNFYADAKAAQRVVAAGLPLTLVPLDVTHQVRFSPQRLRDGLSGRKDLVAMLLRRLGRHAFIRQPQGFALHDPLAVAVAIQPELISTTELPIQVLTGSDAADGITLEDRRPNAPTARAGRTIRVALEVDAHAVLELFSERLFSHSNSPRSPRVITLGGANMDLVVNAARLPLAGETVTGTTLTGIAGGKGANQAIAAQRAGALVSFVASVGNDANGRQLRAALNTEGVDTWSVTSSAAPTGVALITVDAKGQNQITVAPGANATVSTQAIDLAASRWQGAAVLLTQFEVPMPSVVEALKLARAYGLLTIVNPSPIRKLPLGFAALVDVLVPNEVEAGLMLGETIRTRRDANNALTKFAKLGFAKVVLTLGDKGCVWAHDDARGATTALPCKALDTTAAGDTFAGYLAAALAAGDALAEAVAVATAAAGLSVQKQGAQPSIPYYREVAMQLGPAP